MRFPNILQFARQERPGSRYAEFEGKSTLYIEEGYVILLHRVKELLPEELEELGRLRDEIEWRLGTVDYEKYSRMVFERQAKFMSQLKISNPKLYELMTGTKDKIGKAGGF